MTEPRPGLQEHLEKFVDKMEALEKFQEIPALAAESKAAWSKARGVAAREVLAACGGNKAEATRLVGMNRTNFDKILKY